MALVRINNQLDNEFRHETPLTRSGMSLALSQHGFGDNATNSRLDEINSQLAFITEENILRNNSSTLMITDRPYSELSEASIPRSVISNYRDYLLPSETITELLRGLHDEVTGGYSTLASLNTTISEDKLKGNL